MALAKLLSPVTVAVLLSPPRPGDAVVAGDGGGVVVADAAWAKLSSPVTVAVLLSPTLANGVAVVAGDGGGVVVAAGGAGSAVVAGDGGGVVVAAGGGWPCCCRR